MFKNLFIYLFLIASFQANAEELVSLTNMNGVKFELKVPVKLICNSQSSIGYQKDSNNLRWTPDYKKDTSGSFIFILDKVKNFKSTDKEECLSEVMKNTSYSTEFRNHLLEEGSIMCGVKQYHTLQNFKIYKTCHASFTKDEKGIRCNNFVYSLSDKNYLEPIEDKNILILGMAAITQGVCTAIP
jgi:hypothetical protein